MGKLYSNGFLNADSGLSHLAFFDDADNFVFFEVRKFAGHEASLKNNQKEAHEFLNNKWREDADRTRKQGKRIEEISDNQRKKLYVQIQDVVDKFILTATKQGAK